MGRRSGFAQLARSDYGVRIIEIGADFWKEAIFKSLDPAFVRVAPGHPYAGQDPFERILDLVSSLDARTAVVEPCVSSDWDSEYSAVYSRTFEIIPKFCRRVHFFRESISYRDLFQMREKCRGSYLGYTVVRPLRAFRACDTVIASRCATGGHDTNVVHCLERFNVSLMGNALSVVGMPFVQQDTTATVCAEADLWMLARYLNKKGETRRYRTAEIAVLANKALTTGPVRAGLFDLQMMDALRQMDLNPVIVYPDDAAEAVEFIYACLESELPVIAGIPSHVVVVIGHDYRKSYPRGKGIRSLSKAVSTFVVHDDASGPYQMVRRGSAKVPIPGSGTREMLTLNGQPADFYLVAFPQGVHIYWNEVMDTARLWIEEIDSYIKELFGLKVKRVWPAGLLSNLILRPYLRLSSAFKEDILDPALEIRRPIEIIRKYKCMPMPRYLWVVELLSQSDVYGRPLSQRKIRGEIIFDPTGNRHVPEANLIAFHLGGVMFVPGRHGKRGDLIVTEDRPYSPLQRRKRTGT